MTIKILIVDNHQLFIDGIKSILLKEMGMDIIAEAVNGLKALQLLEKNLRPDIIITDIRMPVMDGVVLTKTLTKTYPNIKVLALSMYDQTPDVIEMLDAGAKGYITKNIDKTELINAIHTIIKGDYFFSKNLPQDIKDWFNKKRMDHKAQLTRREKEILTLLAKGRTSMEMAKALKLSKFTIDTHRKNIHKKLGIKTNAGLVNYAIQNLS
ncbi:response regulator transcription factor [Tamlana sp. 2201CG12-4]|uniref:response regulator transcription factor n=1 Tax=Tamlana sp. 2201CG12-4 TaxID=3112582 RepID=UPI002DBBE274|nr:response regulator transcription factor [Tamlana sp. 2201CG12-4]MEC3905843.1 response regulator transcription factor [Tamlana sp. 2201CG12-4]